VRRMFPPKVIYFSVCTKSERESMFVRERLGGRAYKGKNAILVLTAPNVDETPVPQVIAPLETPHVPLLVLN